MATASELHRAADLLEFALDVRKGKKRQRAGWRGRAQHSAALHSLAPECEKA
jgi:hypothetical protein